MKADAALRATEGLKRYDKVFVKQTLIPTHSWASNIAARRISKDGRPKVMWIALRKLRSRQRFINYYALRRYIRKSSQKLPDVMRVGRSLILWDGNHRVSAAIYLGRTRIKCQVWQALRK